VFSSAFFEELINSYEDHQPFVILQQAGSEGFSLHGGPLVAGVDYQGVKVIMLEDLIA